MGRRISAELDGRRIEVEVEQDIARPVKLTFSDYEDDRAQLTILLPRIFFTHVRSNSFLNEQAKKSIMSFSGVMTLLTELISQNASDHVGRMRVLEGVQKWTQAEIAKAAMERADSEVMDNTKAVK
jgi:hypothetical protein